jgi:glycine/D-amino acid oxidase-like deaminating enzyme
VSDPATTALADALPVVYWPDASPVPDGAPQLRWATSADLVVIGGGFTGLWTALLASDEVPGRSVVLLEAEQVGFGASSRNGGFLEASLTHGLGNGLSHWPDEIDQLLRLGSENYREIVSFIRTEGLDVGLEETGVVHVATQAWHVDDLAEMRSAMDAHGLRNELLDGDRVRDALASPTYVGGLLDPDGNAIVDPARLVWGLRASAEARGVSIHEESPVVGIDREGDRLVVRTPNGRVSAEKVVVATNAFARPVRSMRRYIVPVYDYVLMTEPLSSEQLASIGWAGRQAFADVSNQFHYYRLTSDNRILWGGYDAVYRFGGPISPELDQAGDTHVKLAGHFFDTFPQLEGLRFTHKWAGPIGTTTRFTAAWGRAHRGDVVWVGGYTGLGVGASRFGARVALDLVDGVATERTELEMVRRRPMPFPPEPVRSAGIQLTRRALAKADTNEGRRGPWLALLDRFGVGFDS